MQRGHLGALLHLGLEGGYARATDSIRLLIFEYGVSFRPTSAKDISKVNIFFIIADLVLLLRETMSQISWYFLAG